MRFLRLPLALLTLVVSCAAALRVSKAEDGQRNDLWKGKNGDPSPTPPNHLVSPLLVPVTASAVGNPPPTPPNPPTLPPRRPVVVWHGLGDNYASAGMTRFAELIKEMHEGIFVYLVRISDEPSQDQRAGWFGDVDEQVAQVAEVFAEMEELQGGFDAIGFSQGGQFLRAYVERYNNPPVRNLITFGSQHMGVSDLPGCKPTDFLCRAARAAAGSGVYTPWAQKNLVQAQYFRDHKQYDAYLASNHFLTDINNEHPVNSSLAPTERNQTYFDNFVSLDSLVLVLFDQDQTVVPKESAWFGSYAIPTEDDSRNDEPEIVDMEDQPLYQEDWIGLRTLDEKDKVFSIVCVGRHMEISDECWRPIVKKWVGSVDLDIPEDPKSIDVPPLLLQDW